MVGKGTVLKISLVIKSNKEPCVYFRSTYLSLYIEKRDEDLFLSQKCCYGETY